MRKHLNFALEQDTPAELKSGGAVDDPSQREGLSPEDDVSDLDHVSDQLDAAATSLEAELLQIEEAVEVGETLTELAIVAQEGLTEPAARILHLATESLLARVGDTGIEGGIALEAEADTITQSQGIAEKIGNKARKIWQAIIAAIKRAIVWFKSFCRKLFDAAPRLKKRAQDLIAKLDSVQGEPSVKEMNNLKLAGDLHVAGKVDTNSIVKGANTTVEVLDPYFKRLMASELFSEGFLKHIEDGDVVYDPAKRREIFKLVSAGAAGEIRKMFGRQEFEGEYWRAEEMLGGRVIACELQSKEDTNVEQAIRKHTLTPWLAFTDKTMGRNDVEKLAEHVGVGDVRQIRACLQSAVQLSVLIEEFRKVQDKLENLADKCVAMAQELDRKWGQSQEKGKEGDTDADGKTRPHNALISAQRYFFAATPRMFVHEPATIVSYALRSTAALCSWAEASMKLYKTEEAKTT